VLLLRPVFLVCPLLFYMFVIILLFVLNNFSHSTWRLVPG
jgi:hypothetical protein